MATKAEQFRNREQRSRQRPTHTSRKTPKKSAWSHERAHADVKATHVLEDTAPGKRPSRVSTRTSSNRAKSDASFNKTEEKRKGAPASRAHKAQARRTRVRGAGASQPRP